MEVEELRRDAWKVHGLHAQTMLPCGLHLQLAETHERIVCGLRELLSGGERDATHVGRDIARYLEDRRPVRIRCCWLQSLRRCDDGEQDSRREYSRNPTAGWMSNYGMATSEHGDLQELLPDERPDFGGGTPSRRRATHGLAKPFDGSGLEVRGMRLRRPHAVMRQRNAGSEDPIRLIISLPRSRSRHSTRTARTGTATTLPAARRRRGPDS